jgi:cell division protein ZapE
MTRLHRSQTGNEPDRASQWRIEIPSAKQGLPLLDGLHDLPPESEKTLALDERESIKDTSMTRLKQLYADRIAAGQIIPDLAQQAAVDELDQLAASLSRRSTVLFGSGSEPVRGVYLWGAVGRGKSLLMDLFFQAASVKSKRRVHFHDLMLETHAFIFEWRKSSATERRRHPAYVRGAGDDPIAPAARNIARTAGLLCLDEFHVTSITDAMILGRLFDRLFEMGVTIVATSNRRPGELYQNGINRQLFLPFIAQIEQKLTVIELRSSRDFRLDRLQEAPVYHAPLSEDADQAMDAAFRRLTAGERPQPSSLEVQGRIVIVPAQAAGVARFSFMDLCGSALGPADYLAIARRYHTVFVDNTPRLSPERRDWAARFVTLIDALYEAKTKLVISADGQPDTLYQSGDGAFEFQRTASRLHEMRSSDYLSLERENTVVEV